MIPTKIDYLLVCLVEECAEVQKNCAKALRFGLDNYDTESQLTNRRLLRDGLIDVLAVTELLVETDDLGDPREYSDLIRLKKEKVMELARKK